MSSVMWFWWEQITSLLIGVMWLCDGDGPTTAWQIGFHFGDVTIPSVFSRFWFRGKGGGGGANYSTGVSMYTIWHGRPRRCVTCAYPKCMWIANHSRRVCSTALVVSCPTRVSRDLGVACVSEYHTLGRVIFIGTKECRLINYDKLLAENWPLLHCVYVCVCIVCMVVQYVCI